MLTEALFKELKLYIDEHLETELYSAPQLMFSAKACMAPRAVYEYSDVDEFIASNKRQPFNQVLFELIDQKGMRDSEVYKRAGLDRRLFSKIRASEGYHPGKNTIIALALALELDKENAGKLLGSAGYTLSTSDIFDLVILFCLEKKIYSLHEVNAALDYFSLKPLAGAEF